MSEAQAKSVIEEILKRKLESDLQRGLEQGRLASLAAEKLLLSESEAMQVSAFFEEWEPNKSYETGKRLRHGFNSNNENQLYDVVQAHVSRAEGPPPSAPALYRAIGFSSDGTGIWTQPLGAHDAYNEGDIVFHGNALWVSEISGNVWEPGVFGWKEQK